MTNDQFVVLLKYWGMGSERSLVALHEALVREYSAASPKRKAPALITLKDWSSKFGWQGEIARMDDEANEKLYSAAVGAARDARVDILKIFKAVVLRFATQIKENPAREITSADIAAFWKMARVEMGMPVEQGGASAEVNVKPNADGSFDLTARVRKYEDPQ